MGHEDSIASVVDHIKYDAYGNILSQTSSANQPRLAYAGMQLDQATGLYYDNARYYNPATGTFLSQDPKGFAGGNSNLYGYVNNDPTNLVDPSGLSPKGGPGGRGGSGGPGGPHGGGPGGGGGSNTPGAYHYSNDQLNGSWISNFIDDFFDQDDYGTAGDVTPSDAVVTATEVAFITGQALLGAASGLDLAYSIWGLADAWSAAGAGAVEAGAEATAASTATAAGTGSVLADTAEAATEAGEAEAAGEFGMDEKSLELGAEQ